MITFEHGDTDNLAFVEEICWKMLAEAVGNRKSPMHTVVVGTPNGHLAHMRTVVIRRVDTDEKKVYFHTDIRSSKIAEIRSSGHLSWLAYDPMLRSQVRLSGKTELHHMDDMCRSHWDKTRHFSRRCYLLPEGPGLPLHEGLPESDEKLGNFKYTLEESEAGFQNFVVVRTDVDWMEWYYTYSRGNKRASFRYLSGLLREATWLTP